jgi:hypothetical protein
MAYKMEFFWENDDFADFLRWLVEDMEYNTKMIIDVVEKPYHNEGSYCQFKDEKYKDICDHKNKFYQPEERDTNIPESYTCDDCGKEFDIPEPDFDLNNKE